MTALVAIENCDVKTMVEVSPCAVGVEGSSIYLYEGEKLTLEDLLYAMLLESANDAAAAIAIAVGGSIEGFADLMNEKAAELGLENTHFTNPHGLDNDEHYTTARELAVIAGEALRNEVFREIVSTYKKDIPLNETEGVRLLINHNKLLKSYEGSVGVKTGYTKKSGRCLVSAAERDGLFLICVTLNAPDDWQDHSTILDYGFSLYESRILCLDGEYQHVMPIVGGDQDYVVLTNKGDVKVTLPRDAGEIKCSAEIFNFEYAPIYQGEVGGRLIYTQSGKTVATVPLYAKYTVERKNYKKNLWERFVSMLEK
jgi:D-alanyl-D-alanine carboxypeptidase/D-alanyl-D-alanine carboxypeptidase (penicillin-binding protein 5/6)